MKADTQSLQSRFEAFSETVMEGHKILDSVIPREVVAKDGAEPKVVGAIHSADDCKQSLAKLLSRMRDIANQVGQL